VHSLTRGSQARTLSGRQWRTLFLDEVGLAPERAQAKVLKAIEDRPVRDWPDSAEKVDVSIITATNADLVTSQQRTLREESSITGSVSLS